jgi:hypothetical protein
MWKRKRLIVIVWWFLFLYPNVGEVHQSRPYATKQECEAGIKAMRFIRVERGCYETK